LTLNLHCERTLVTAILRIVTKLLEQPKVVISPTQLFFSVDKPAWYIIGISARVRSEKQRGKEETDDEELTIELDSTTFPKINTDNDLKDAPAAFSGGTQHNKEKIVQIIAVLAQGDHKLTLTPQHQAEIITSWYEPLTLTDNKISLVINNRANNLDEQPWMTFALVSQCFAQVTIEAKIWWHFFNGDDLQVRINGLIIPHDTNYKRHKHWLFHAQAVWDIFGREQIETLQLSKLTPEQKITYVELWADRSPLLQKIVFEGNDLEKNLEVTSQLHQYSVGPNRENFNKHDEIIARIVNEINQNYSSQPYPPPELLDQNLVKAMMYVESKMGYYQAAIGSYAAFPDVMQIADPLNPAIHTLNNDDWVDPITSQEVLEYTWTPEGIKIMDYDGRAKVNSIEDSVYWGVIWLYHKAEIIEEDGSRSWRSWNEAVTRYNGGGDTNYTEKVSAIYEKGDWQ